MQVFSVIKAVDSTILVHTILVHSQDSKLVWSEMIKRVLQLNSCNSLSDNP